MPAATHITLPRRIFALRRVDLFWSSSTETMNSAGGWLCQIFLASSARGLLLTWIPSMKTSSQYGLDAMDLNAHVSCGHAYDFADRFSFKVFEIKEHELAIK